MEPHPDTSGKPPVHVNKRLKIRLQIYFALSVVLIGVVIYDIVSDAISPLFPLLGLIAGAVIGVIVSRISRISWDHGAQQVISRFDEIGALILVLYVVFEVFKEEIIESFVHGPAVVATSTALLTGIMIGRVWGIGGTISRVLKEQNKPSSTFRLFR